jgi:hypothetical protein
MLTVITDSDVRRHVALIDLAFRFATPSSSRRRAGRRTCANLMASSAIVRRFAKRLGAVRPSRCRYL